MKTIEQQIELLEDIELDNMSAPTPIFSIPKHFDKDLNPVEYKGLDKNSQKGCYVQFKFKGYERAFMRTLDFMKKDGNIYFNTKEVEEVIKENQKREKRLRCYPCFVL